MGLFSKNKKKKAEAAAEAAARDAAAAAAAREAAAAAAAKAAKDAQVQKEKANVKKIVDKRKDIERLENAVKGFNAEREKNERAALAAKRAGNTREAVVYMRKVNRLKERIKQYDSSIITHTKQLDAYEDMAFHSQNNVKNEDFVADIGDISETAEKVGETLDDVREKLADVDNINMTIKADAALDQEAYGEESMLDALADLEADAEKNEALAETHDLKLGPNVPVGQPTMPSAAQTEEDEIARMERDLKALETAM